MLGFVLNSYITISLDNLTFSWRRPLSYRNQSIDLLRKSMDWFLYANSLRHEKVNLQGMKHYFKTYNLQAQ